MCGTDELRILIGNLVQYKHVRSTRVAIKQQILIRV